MSILQHVSINHAWEGNEVVHACEHETLDDAELRTKKWLPRGSPIHTALMDIVTDPKLLGDLPHLTRFSHSGELGVFHALCNMYCPKRFGFCYSGIVRSYQIGSYGSQFGYPSESIANKTGTYTVQNCVFSNNIIMGC